MDIAIIFAIVVFGVIGVLGYFITDSPGALLVAFLLGALVFMCMAPNDEVPDTDSDVAIAHEIIVERSDDLGSLYGGPFSWGKTAVLVDFLKGVI